MMVRSDPIEGEVSPGDERYLSLVKEKYASYFSTRNDYFQEKVEIALTKLRKNPRYSLIENTISEIESWICFRQDKLKANSSPISPGLENFTKPSKSTKAQSSKKKEMQKQARRKNRSKKK